MKYEYILFQTSSEMLVVTSLLRIAEKMEIPGKKHCLTPKALATLSLDSKRGNGENLISHLLPLCRYTSIGFAEPCQRTVSQTTNYRHHRIEIV